MYNILGSPEYLIFRKFSGIKSKTKVAQLEMQSWEQEKQNEIIKIEKFINQKTEELAKHNEAIQYYKLYGEKLANEILKVANLSYKNGEIDFFQYIVSLENATTIRVDYLDNVLQYNKTIYQIQYLTL